MRNVARYAKWVLVGVLVLVVAGAILLWMAGLKTEQEGAAPKAAVTVGQVRTAEVPAQVQQPLKPGEVIPSASNQAFTPKSQSSVEVKAQEPENPIFTLIKLVLIIVVIAVLLIIVIGVVIFRTTGEVPPGSEQFVKRQGPSIQVDRGAVAYIENQLTGNGWFVGPGTHWWVWPLIYKVVGLPGAEFMLSAVRQDIDFLDIEREPGDESMKGMVDGWVEWVLSVHIVDPALMVKKLSRSVFTWSEVVSSWAEGYVNIACRNVTFPNLEKVIPMVIASLNNYLEERGIKVVNFQIKSSDVADRQVKAAYARRAELAIQGDAEAKYQEQVGFSPQLLVVSQATREGLLGTTLVTLLLDKLGISMSSKEGREGLILREEEEEE